MNTEKDEFVSHMNSVGETTLDFFSHSGMSGWPTILAIQYNTIIQPDAMKWVEKSGLTFPPAPKVGDNVHWYKIKYDMKSNIRRSIPFILRDGTFFNTKNISEVINSCKTAFQTTNSIYFFNSETDVKICKIDDKDPDNNSKSISSPNGPSVGKILDVLSVEKYDYILTQDYVYRFDSSKVTDESPQFEAWYKGSSMNAFALVSSDVIVIATENGGIRLSNLKSSSPTSQTIKKETGTYTPPAESDPSGGGGDSSGAVTSVTYDNGVPQSCKFVWPKGSSYYIGDGSTSGYFEASAISFTPEYSDDIESKHKEFLSSKPNRNYKNKSFIEKDGKTYYGNTAYSITGVNCILDSDDFLWFGNNSGITIFSQAQIDSKYGPTDPIVTLKGISGSVTSILDMFGVIHSVGDTKMRSFDSEDEDNKTRLYLFGTDYDQDMEANETDIRLVKLAIKDILNLAKPNSRYDQLCGKANNKSTTYAMAVVEGSPNSYHLYGNDNRNSGAIEMKNAMTSFDLEIDK